jgi:hypothetical protein
MCVLPRGTLTLLQGSRELFSCPAKSTAPDRGSALGEEGGFNIPRRECVRTSPQNSPSCGLRGPEP